VAVIGGGCKCCWAEQFALLLDFVGFGCWCCRIVVCTVRVRHCGVVGVGCVAFSVQNTVCYGCRWVVVVGGSVGVVAGLGRVGWLRMVLVG
jgi:hypothetical protein